MNERFIDRLNEIIKIADKLGWIYPKNISKISVSYPLMQLSDVEKCMDAMVNDFELERMRTWEKENEGKIRGCPKCGSTTIMHYSWCTIHETIKPQPDSLRLITHVLKD